MPRKAMDVCRAPGCRRRTWSGRAHRDPSVRYCAQHAPWGAVANLRPTPSPRPPTGARAHVAFLALACVFRSFRVDPDGVAELYGAICGHPAPRQLRGDRSRPRFPNRFGEPLCALHERFARDERAFPGGAPEADPNEDPRARAMLGRLAADLALLEE